MDVSSLDLVENSKNLHSFYGVNSIIEIVVNKIREIPQHERLNRSIDLVLKICQLIENLCHDNNIKGEPNFKLDIAVKIFEKLGNVKPEDKEFLVNAIKFLHSSGNIKRVNVLRRVWRSLKNVISKKE